MRMRIGATRRQRVKIFGERNTGTNALKQLIEKNSDSRVLPSVASELDPWFPLKWRTLALLPGGKARIERYIDGVFRGRTPTLAWKHAATNLTDVSDFSDCLVVLTTRHPASWALALYRRPYHSFGEKPSTFPEFLSMRWQPVTRDALTAGAFTPIEMWNMKMRSYVTFASALATKGAAHVWVRFEDFVGDQEAVFDRLRGCLTNPAETCSIVSASTKDPSKDYAYYRDYYRREAWATEIDPDSEAILTDAVDWSIAVAFGYRPPADLHKGSDPGARSRRS